MIIFSTEIEEDYFIVDKVRHSIADQCRVGVVSVQECRHRCHSHQSEPGRELLVVCAGGCGDDTEPRVPRDALAVAVALD